MSLSLSLLVTGSERVYVDKRLLTNNKYNNPIIHLSNAYLDYYPNTECEEDYFNDDKGYLTIRRLYNKYTDKFETNLWNRHRIKFKKILKEHGMYSKKFYQEYFLSDFIRNRLEFDPFLKSFDSFLEYERHWEGHTKEYRLQRIFFDFLLYECITPNKEKTKITDSNQFIFRRYVPEVDKWIQYANDVHKCSICGNDFSISDIPYWVYYGSNAYNNCCFKCQIVEYPDKNQCKVLLHDFINTCQFIPNQKFSPIDRNFTTLLGGENYCKVIKILASFGGYNHIKEVFGEWINALYESNIIEELSIKKGRSYKCIANDKHVCNSMAELIIDNYLSKNNIKHEKEPRYPFHKDYNPSKLRRADWLINDEFYVEYFGLAGDDKYDIKTIEKINLCKEADLKLISIFPNDLAKLDFVFKEFLK